MFKEKKFYAKSDFDSNREIVIDEIKHDIWYRHTISIHACIYAQCIKYQSSPKYNKQSKTSPQC